MTQSWLPRSEFTLQEGLSLRMCLQAACPVHSSLLFFLEVPLNGCDGQRDTPCSCQEGSLFLHRGLLYRIQQSQEKPMRIQVHQAEGSSRQNRKNPHSWCSQNINLEFQPAHCFHFAVEELLLKVYSHIFNEIQTFTRAMKINGKSSAFRLFLAFLTFAGTVILHF